MGFRQERPCRQARFVSKKREQEVHERNLFATIHNNTSHVSSFLRCVVAMLADTGCALQRMAGRESIRVVATMQSNLTPNVERIVKNWFPSLVTMDYVKLGSTCMLDFVVPPECKIQSSWVIKVTDNNVEESHSKSGFSLVEKKTDGVSLIIWCHQ